MSTIGAPLFVIVPSESNAPVFHAGKILESGDGNFVAEFDRLQSIPVGSAVQVYTEIDGKFFRQKALVERVGGVNPGCIMSFQRTGPRESAEKRCSYRVKIASMPLAGQIGQEKKCSITDISPEGFAAITSKALDFGSTVHIHVEYEGQVLEGQAILQSISRLPNEKFRCGFLIPERTPKMRRSLERISFMIQRLQLRNTAGFRSLDTNVEVNGEIIHSIIEGIGAFRETAARILAKQGIIDPQPGEWYNQQSWLDALGVIAERLGPDALYNIGLKIPDHSEFPPEVDSLEKALQSFDKTFQTNHRNGLIGHYYFSLLPNKKFEIVCETAYPCDFDRGILDAICGRFKAPGQDVSVTHESSKPCRRRGGNSCTFHVSP